MRRLSLIHSLAFSMSCIVCIVCIILSILFSWLYYVFADHEVKNLLTETGTRIVNQYLAEDNQAIKYLPQTDGMNLTDYLRSRDVSAVIFDQNQQRIGTFGAYRFIFENADESTIEAITKPLAMTTEKTIFSHVTAQDSLYELYTLPLVKSGTHLGTLQLARQTSFVRELQRLNIAIILMVIPILAFVVWILVYVVATNFLRPLNQLMKLFASVSTESFPTELTTDSKFIELHNLVEACNAMIGRLKEGIENEKYFSAFASHELRTPLTRAMTSLELVASKLPLDRQKQMMLIADQIEDVNKTLDSLLLLLQPLNPGSAKANFSKAWEKLIPQIKKEVQEKEILLKLDSPFTGEISMLQEHLDILLRNLITNAIKYSDRGKTVRIYFQQSGNTVSLRVTNQGKIIARSEQQSIFQPFFRTSNVLSVPGIGIGLALVKRLCIQYGLSISLRSSQETGTTFTILGFSVAKP